jgi:hypothetical protein
LAIAGRSDGYDRALDLFVGTSHVVAVLLEDVELVPDLGGVPRHVARVRVLRDES